MNAASFATIVTTRLVAREFCDRYAQAREAATQWVFRPVRAGACVRARGDAHDTLLAAVSAAVDSVEVSAEPGFVPPVRKPLVRTLVRTTNKEFHQ